MLRITTLALWLDKATPIRDGKLAPVKKLHAVSINSDKKRKHLHICMY